MRLNNYFDISALTAVPVLGKGLEEFEATAGAEPVVETPETPEDVVAGLDTAEEAQAHYVGEVEELQQAEVALEQYLDVVAKANRTGYGLSPDAVKLLGLGLEHWERKFPMPALGLEDYPVIASSAQGADNAEKGIMARLKKVWEMIKKAYAHLKEAAAAYYHKITSSMHSLDKRCEQLQGKLKDLKNNPDAADFEVKNAPMLFTGTKFIGQEPASMKEFNYWAFNKYPTDLDRYIKEITQLIRDIRPESTHVTFTKALLAVKMPIGNMYTNLHHKDKEGVFYYDDLPGNKVLMIDWPKMDDSYRSVAEAVRGFNIDMGTLADAPASPESVTVTPSNVDTLKRRLDTISKAVKEAMLRESDVRSVNTAIVSLNTATEDCHKRNGSPTNFGADGTKHPSLLATYLVGSVQKMSTTGINNILAYVAKAYHAQLMLIDREIAAHEKAPTA